MKLSKFVEGDKLKITFYDHCAADTFKEAVPAILTSLGFFIKVGIFRKKRYLVTSMDFDFEDDNTANHPFSVILASDIISVEKLVEKK